MLSKGKCVNDAAQSAHDVRPLLDFVGCKFQYGILMEDLDLKTGFYCFVVKVFS